MSVQAVSPSSPARARTRRPWFTSKRLFPWLLLLPCLIVLVVVGVAPLLFVLTLSVSDFMIGQPLEFAGLEHFRTVLQDPRFWLGMRITFWFITVSVGIQLLLGMINAWALTRIHFLLRYVVLTVMLTPMLLAPTLVGLMWKMLFKARFGPIDYLITQLGLSSPQWLADPFPALLAVTIADVWQWTPFITLLIFAGLESQSQETLEAAYVDGASLWQAFRHVTLPLLAPFVYLAVFLRIIDAFKTFDVIWGITKGGPGSATESIALYTHKVAFTSFQLGPAAVMSLLQLIVIIVIGKLLFSRLNSANSERRSMAGQQTEETGGML